MKKVLLVSLIMFALFGCQKERCYECTATCTVDGYSATSTSVICGDYTKKEVEDMTMSTSSAGTYCTVECHEQ